MKPVALITGASRGLGAAIAARLVAAGMQAVLAVRRPADCDRVLADLHREYPGSCSAVACDVSRVESVREAVAQALAIHGRIDVLVNNAGTIDPIGLLHETGTQAWADSIGVNLVGAFNMCHAVLPGMLARGGGAIVNISSGAAHAPRVGWSAYCAGKAGLQMLTRSLDLEYAERGVSVYGLQPGLVDTDMQSKIRASGINEISRVARAALAPADRPASVVAWLCRTRPQDLCGRDLAMADADLVERAAQPMEAAT